MYGNITSTINIRNTDGSLINLAPNIAKLMETTNQMSVLDRVIYTKFMAKGWYPHRILRKVKRIGAHMTVSDAYGNLAKFITPTAQVLGEKTIGLDIKQDNIAIDDYDRMTVNQQNDIIALEASDFLLTTKEQDLHDLLSKSLKQAMKMKLWTTQDTGTGAPTGVQPAQATTVADALTAIRGGGRVSGAITDLDVKPESRVALLRESIAYLNKLGAPNSIELLYPYSINGLPIPVLTILSAYQDVVKLKDTDTKVFINLNDVASRRYNAIVGAVDTVPILLSNQLPKGTAYALMSNNVIVRTTQLPGVPIFVGSVNNAASYAKADGTAVNLPPSSRLIQFEYPRLLGVLAEDQIIFINGKDWKVPANEIIHVDTVDISG